MIVLPLYGIPRKLVGLVLIFDVPLVKTEMAGDPLERLAINHLIKEYEKAPTDFNLAFIMQYDFLQPRILSLLPEVVENKSKDTVAMNGLSGSMDWTACSVQLCWYLHLATIQMNLRNAISWCCRSVPLDAFSSSTVDIFSSCPRSLLH
jgi:hypothetical protein|eukprot:NODE_1041_length_1818_cov_2.579407.p3 type:complete len:149 gc:universal NODE_1041_length_1818_cov_2.579407:1712-1266(-)